MAKSYISHIDALPIVIPTPSSPFPHPHPHPGPTPTEVESPESPMKNRMDMMILDGSFLGGKGFYSLVCGAQGWGGEC